MAIEKYSDKNTYVSILNENHLQQLDSFNSKNVELNQFLVKDAFGYQELHLGKTYILFNQESKIVSYLTLAMGALKIPDKQEFEFHGKKLKQYPKDFPNQFPALLIGKLATNKEEEGKGGAGLLLDYAVKKALQLREQIDCSHLIVHAYPESIEWHKAKGFKTHLKEVTGRETIPMYFEL